MSRVGGLPRNVEILFSVSKAVRVGLQQAWTGSAVGPSYLILLLIVLLAIILLLYYSITLLLYYSIINSLVSY